MAEDVRGVLHVTREPISTKSAWINLGMWGAAGLIAAGSLTLDVLESDYNPMFYVNCGVLVLDVVMLRLAITGFARRNKGGSHDA